MTDFSWKDLKPHVPLGPGDRLYVERPGSAGEEIARWISADRSTLLVGGPAGVGKSTEVARAAELLQPDRVACLVQLDRFENMRRLTPDRMLLRIVQEVGFLATQVLNLPLSRRLKTAIDRVGEKLQGEYVAQETTPTALLNATLVEVSRLSRQGRVTLLVDGLEKVPQGTGSQELFEALALIRDEVDLVVVIPWHAAFGPHAETVIRADERFIAVRAVDVEGAEGELGREFFRKLLLQRLSLPEESLYPERVVRAVGAQSIEEVRALTTAHRVLVDDAIRWSAGVPRVFLQLMADAGSYAKLRGRGAWPDAEDLTDACADQVDSFRRLLLPGDIDAIRAAVGTSGSELPLDRKVRLMAHGVLLERMRAGGPLLEAHPLIQAALGHGGADA
ncbi:MAG: hypothetical protein R6X02_17780 [Enhygromyxa sp.]